MTAWIIAVCATITAIYLTHEVGKIKDELHRHKIVQSEVLDEYRRTAERIIKRLKEG